jgi:hypothetical protein
MFVHISPLLHLLTLCIQAVNLKYTPHTHMHNIHLLLQINVLKDKLKNYKYTLKLTKKTFSRVTEKRTTRLSVQSQKNIKTITDML